MSRFAIFLTLLLLAGLGAGGYLGYRQHQTQARLGKLLQQLDETLATQNDEAAKKAKETLLGIEETVAKNRNPPAELAVLHRAQALGSQVQGLCDTLRGWQRQLRRAAGGPTAPGPLRHPEATAAVIRLLGRDTQGQRALHHQLTACADTLRRLGPTAPAQLTTLPTFDGLPAADALAALTQLEAQVRASEARTCRHLARPLGAPSFPIHFMAAATAERATVAPGATYRARLLVIKALSPKAMRMHCNNQSVAVGPDGVGSVRFRAPTKPGLASWKATICLHQNGRDTTFVVRVPYRVARR